MTLHIQDPDDPESLFLLEALLEACEGSIRGGGAFAFASVSGVRLLLQDEAFVEFASSHAFDLIIGVDAVTNVSALQAIQVAAQQAPGITASAFLSDHIRSLFHPKLTWFKTRKGGRLIVGSGNLTGGGLRSNWEGFSIETLGRPQAEAVEEHWETFKARNAGKLLPLDDPRIIASAQANVGREPPARTAARAAARTAQALQAAAVPPPSEPILIAEIPQSGNRWKQANFDLNTFQTFFQVRPGSHQRVVFYHVDRTGAVHPPVSQPSVAVRSRNFRFELEAAAGLAYPARGRPIGVFRRTATRTFYYCLVMPLERGHGALDALLARYALPANPRLMRRVEVDAAVIAAAWPTCPILAEPQGED